MEQKIQNINETFPEEIFTELKEIKKRSPWKKNWRKFIVGTARYWDEQSKKGV